MHSFLILLFSLFACGAVHAAALTEADAVKRGMAQPDIVALLDARRGIAAGNAASAGRWANPEIEYSREALDLPGGVSEDRFLWIRQRLNIAGVHGLERDAAARLRVAEDARTEFAAREIAADIRALFYETLATDARAQVLAAWHERLQELVTAVTNRATAGDASRYDQLRLERELALIRGEMLDAKAKAESARDRLFSLIGGEPVALQGYLLPPSMDAAVVTDVLTSHPLLKALDAEAGSAVLSAKAARREAWPELTVGVGRREFAEPGFDDGNVLSLGVTVPLFDRGTGEARAADSRARRLTAERALTEARLAADTRATVRALEARREAALALKNVGVAEPDSLAAIAESAYAAGEIGVMELIDAHRTELAAHRESVDRALAARDAYIELQLLRGEHP